MLETEIKNWYREHYLISTEPGLIQIDQVSAAFNSDVACWANSLPIDALKKTLRNSLCLGLYALPESTSESASKSLRQVGLVRIITDDVTFAYMTDVYVLPEHQSKGLGRWLLGCVDELIKNWPHLRRLMFLTDEQMPFYRKTIGAKEWSELGMSDIKIGVVRGVGSSKHG
ncbi:putative GNAT family N-acetyltransferase [Truncatella angustata]|uniref:GNAT family N-acetyltransferase n=1 Tax=Truncatella angustata TaxID=152316 RepID=A0A9P8RKQ8_9PEZI|nr:putative GNAT family N-acetyltransferase [Truncatella angustata]KAH6644951.1 putative GNAT family N-acetyltransferase [Truncatella angustata]